ncbi:hypothetical protein ABW20_dc0106437 [Dactylellina cionopaga]|nr:hypothetical protein ABW20_dc0106437 [Dactylellina cionopaga]
MSDVIDLTPPPRTVLRAATSRAAAAAAAAATRAVAVPQPAVTRRTRGRANASEASVPTTPSTDSSTQNSPGLFLSEVDDETSEEEETSQSDLDDGYEQYEEMLANLERESTEESGSEIDSDVDNGVTWYSSTRSAQPATAPAPAPFPSRTRTRTNTQATQPPPAPNPSARPAPVPPALPKPIATNNTPLKRTHKQTESTAAATSSEPAAKKAKVEDAQVVDMVDVEDDDDVQKLVQQQMLKAQREEGEARRRIADFKCVICLDDPTDLSTTPCGHLFCNECIKTTLRFGKPQAKYGKCPVCRGKVMIKDIVPLELKFIKKVQGKGKGKA